ncbi:MAG: tyrosine-type recombinase/integrase [Verrucomicrobiales bacterium]|nr:tyrosine-type recombinase/integrase [Verrucomicrobiales bacterium]
MKSLRKSVRDYLQLRRGLGFKLNVAEVRLGQFLEFLKAKKSSRITTKLALQFATQAPHWTPGTQAGRLAVVRGFARYHRVHDPATEVPLLGLLSSAYRPAPPYLYSETEIMRLLEAAKAYPAWLRFPGPRWRHFQAWTFYCIFGLLAVSGMRIGEVLNLLNSDINWSEGLLTIRHAKLSKSRLVPLHASTLKALKTFVRHRDCFFSELRPRPEVSHFFVSSRGTRLYYTHVYKVFLIISRRIGLRAAHARRGPRLHHLRHRFAIETLLRWYRAGEKVERLLPVLSTYLGHSSVTNTYWYLRCTPELMAAASNLLERRWKGIR